MQQPPLFAEVVFREALERSRAYREFRRRVLPQALAIVGASYFATLFKGSMETATEGAWEYAEANPGATYGDLAEGLAKALICRLGGDDWDSEEARDLLREIAKCMSH